MPSRTDRPVSGDLPPCPYGRRYNEGCRCEACRTRQTLYQKRYRRNLAKAQWGIIADTTRIDPERACKAIWDASSVRGLTLNEIARVSGIAPQTVHDLYHQRRRWIEKQTEEKILKHYGPDAPERREYKALQVVDFVPHRWKLLSLYAQGWTSGTLRERLKKEGRPYRFLDCSTTQQIRVQYQSLQSIEWLVEQIGDRHGPSNSNKARMSRRGIFPLIHYTDEGELIRDSLTKPQREAWRTRVQ